MAAEDQTVHLPVRDLLMHLLEYTDEHVIDELWPDNTLTLDDIAGLILARIANELADSQAKAHLGSGYHMGLPCQPAYNCEVRKVIDSIRLGGTL